MEFSQTDILISGGGVAGLTAAAAFGTAGFSVIIVDPNPPITHAEDPGADLRTTAFLQPARDFLASAGLWQKLAPHATALDVMRIIDAGGRRDIPVCRDFVAADISDAPFGWNLPNWLLRREMVARLEELANVTLQAGVGFTSMVARTDHAIVRLSDGSQVTAQLVIGADGRASPVRASAGIGAQTIRYGQKAITFAVTHDAPHGQISTEVHRKGGPFTLVPLPDHHGRPCSSVVWMDDGPEILRLAALSDDGFIAEANERSAGANGVLALASRRSVWPIISQIVECLSAPRTALVGEAAHVVPPIGAQGLNMSVADLAALLDLAKATPHHLGNAPMLAAYEKARYGQIQLRVRGIDALNRASKAGHPAALDLRSLGLRAIHDLSPVRRGLMKLGLGVT